VDDRALQLIKEKKPKSKSHCIKKVEERKSLEKACILTFQEEGNLMKKEKVMLQMGRSPKREKYEEKGKWLPRES